MRLSTNVCTQLVSCVLERHTTSNRLFEWQHRCSVSFELCKRPSSVLKRALITLMIADHADRKHGAPQADGADPRHRPGRYMHGEPLMFRRPVVHVNQWLIAFQLTQIYSIYLTKPSAARLIKFHIALFRPVNHEGQGLTGMFNRLSPSAEVVKLFIKWAGLALESWDTALWYTQERSSNRTTLIDFCNFNK